MTEGSQSGARATCPAWLLLLLLAPAMGELLSGSAPPAEFFNPMAFVALTLLYGGGALLVRELSLTRPAASLPDQPCRVRSMSWPRVFLLGIAYAIIEEGLVCRSFFDPNWPDLTLPTTHSRWGNAAAPQSQQGSRPYIEKTLQLLETMCREMSQAAGELGVELQAG